MLNRLNHTQLLRYAGLFTWAVVGIPLVLSSWYFPGENGDSTLNTNINLRLWVASYLGYGLSYWLVTRSLGMRHPRWYDYGLLLFASLSAIAVSHSSGSGLGGVLLLVVAGVLPWLLPLGVAAAWLVLQHVALVPAFTEGQGFSLLEAALQSALYVGFSSFAFVTGLVAKQQAQARDEQRRLNSELRATRALLAESSRLSERMRISRELHDLLGHHLTALSLNLEVASHVCSGKAQEHVRQAHTLAKLLLTDVREAVSQLREDGRVELGTAMRALCDGVPALMIELDLPEDFALEDPECAHVLLRCAQEIITNTVRHAEARRLSLRIYRAGSAIVLHAKDDGRGAEKVTSGNGLRGMRERLAVVGGTMSLSSARGHGFALEVHLPMEPAHDSRLPG
ncbi:MAG: sensor histidine kinase [Gammaproteobacteria bacterium HGW-Gammaproteobacteria-2]|jgi:signal transduction histidine kinase|nr:MAG: sensor histidine kinase [Gammaproteobacteria bacterium HGW-Gammaproteobacteria-2]